jgi:hypothetical protein
MQDIETSIIEFLYGAGQYFDVYIEEQKQSLDGGWKRSVYHYLVDIGNEMISLVTKKQG